MSALVNGGHGRRIVDEKSELSKRSQVPVSKGAWDKIDHGLTRAATLAGKVEAGSKKAADKGRAAQAKLAELRKPGAKTEALRHRVGEKAAKKIEPEVAQMVRHHGKRVVGVAAGVGLAGAAGGSYAGTKLGNYPGGAKGYVSDKRNQAGHLVATGRDRAADKISVDKADRYYDPENNRQRRSGMFQAGAIGAGAIGVGIGLKGAAKHTKAVRGAIKHPNGKKDKTIAATRRHLAEIGGGTAAMGVGGAEEYNSTHARGKAWS
jgi:hypothetical protein